LTRIVNGRLYTACKALAIKGIPTASLRHFAIACMKASGFSRFEIAVIVNHASNRTATEQYGKARTGFRRAKKLLRFPGEKLLIVRDKARPYAKAFEEPTHPDPENGPPES
jgi:hypothetical protein